MEAGETHEVRASDEEALETLNLYVPRRAEVGVTASERDG